MLAKLRRVQALATVAILLAVSGCVTSRVSGELLVDKPPRVREVEVTVRYRAYEGNNMAARMGQAGLDNLMPHLRARVPTVFSLNGIPATLNEAASGIYGKEPPPIRPGVTNLVLFPVSATHSTGGGLSLHLEASLVNPTTSKAFWHGYITLSTIGGKFDEGVADKVAVKLLDQMRADKLVRLPAKEIRTQ